MPKHPPRPHSRRHIFIEDEDWALLEKSFGKGSQSPLGVSTVIKAVVRKYCQSLRDRQAEAVDRIMPHAEEPELPFVRFDASQVDDALDGEIE